MSCCCCPSEILLQKPFRHFRLDHAGGIHSPDGRALHCPMRMIIARLEYLHVSIESYHRRIDLCRVVLLLLSRSVCRSSRKIGPKGLFRRGWGSELHGVGNDGASSLILLSFSMMVSPFFFAQEESLREGGGGRRHGSLLLGCCILLLL